MRRDGKGLALVGVVSRSAHTEFRVFAQFSAGRPISLSVRVYRRNAAGRAIKWTDGNEALKVPLGSLPDLLEMMNTALRLSTAESVGAAR